MSAPAAEPVVDVHLRRFPLRVAARATVHYNDVFREFALMASATPEQAEGVPIRLLDLIDALGRRYARQESHEEERDAALARGERERDLLITLPVSAGAASAMLDRMLDEADEFCREGALLTLAAPADVTEFRRWYLAQVVAQADGEPPAPWPGPLD